MRKLPRPAGLGLTTCLALILTTLAAPLLLTGCGDDDPTSADGGPRPCTTSLTASVQTPSGSFLPLTPGAAPTEADLVLGFQGFRYVYLRLVLTPPPPDALLASAEITLAGAAPRAQPLGYLRPGDLEPQRLFFNDEALPALVDARATLSLHVGQAGCQADHSGELVLRYRPDCVEGPDGVRVCGDGGVP
ncbi:MAG: hypothetical protein IT370_13160 [Deltaproteobacteria bacterium]|nr:hypothetical protein [Deltaproteobacteria bacterium]